MKTLSKVTCVIGMLMAVAASGCVTSETEEIAAEDTGTAEAASGLCRIIQNYTYQYQGRTYSWDVTTQEWDGRQFVDERRIGGNPYFYRQYRVSPVWSACPHANEWVRLTGGGVVLEGIHVCLPDGREEFHGSDYQRLLVPDWPFITRDCTP